MIYKPTRGILRVTAVAWFFCTLIGCNQDPEIDTSPSNPAFSRLGGIAQLYLQFRSMNAGQIPTEATFKSFAKEKGGYTLGRLEIDSADQLFVSQRDNQPIVLVFGKKLQHEGTPVIAHEAIGTEGKRMVALANGGAVLLTEEQFAAVRK